jgi:serine protease 16
VSTASLRLLSSRQALADLARFHAHATQRFSLPEHTRWVTFGGSYPGMLAAWARLRYPHLIHAAVASSAPVGAVLNFQGYQDVVGRSLADADVGGDAACAASVRAAFAEMGTLLRDADGRRRLEQLFPVCHAADAAKDPLDDDFAAAALTEELSYLFPAQSNDPACTEPACNIDAVCAIMRGGRRDEASPLERLARLAAVALPGDGCMADGRAAAAAALADTSLEGGGGRVWLWQTCTEFGFYQTCDPNSACPFTSSPWLNNLSASLDICAMAFGQDVEYWAARTPAAVASSNEAYGGLTPGSTRVLYVNGDVDPWSAASIAASPGEDAPVIWVQGASHHAWTHPPRDTDSPQVRMASMPAAVRSIIC